MFVSVYLFIFNKISSTNFVKVGWASTALETPCDSPCLQTKPFCQMFTLEAITLQHTHYSSENNLKLSVMKLVTTITDSMAKLYQ